MDVSTTPAPEQNETMTLRICNTGMSNTSVALGGLSLNERYGFDNSVSLMDFHGTPFDLNVASLIPPRSLLGVLPVSHKSFSHLREILQPFLQFSPCFQEVMLLCPDSLCSKIPRVLQEILAEYNTENDHPDLSLKSWTSAKHDSTPRMLTAIGEVTAEWILLMDENGLRDLDDDAQSLLRNPPALPLPVGPLGIPLAGATPHVFLSSTVRLATYLRPPFILPRSSLPEPNLLLKVQSWNSFGQLIARTTTSGAGGILLTKPIFGKDDDLLPDLGIMHGRLNEQLKLGEMEGLRPRNKSIGNSSCIVNDELGRCLLLFSVFLPTPKHVRLLSALLCGLLLRGHQLHVVVYDNDLHPKRDPKQNTRNMVTEHCKLSYTESSGRKATPSWLDGTSNLPHIAIRMKEGSKLTWPSAGWVLDSSAAKNVTFISIPELDLPYCDWMAALSSEEWRSWNIPRIDISVITKDRPRSLTRLLDSLSKGRYFGAPVDLRLNIEQDCDSETLKIAQDFVWPHGSFLLHHRIIHAGLLPAVIESWYPHTDNTYGLLLEDDVELSPLFYAWAKMAILKYRYGNSVDKSPYIFGVSLYQQKNVELRPEGRQPFDARGLFAKGGLSNPSTPYLSQVPCSWGAVYFPHHWREFHDYINLRFSEEWVDIDEVVVPNVRSNNWSKSWKKFFIELVHLRGYVMLYPNFENFTSLSTNHLEYGSHVRVRSQEKKNLFVLPLMPLPVESPSTSGLLDLPNQILPRFRDLPIINLTGALSTLDDLIQVGRLRGDELRGGHVCELQEVRRYDVRDLMCIKAASNVPIQ